MHVENGEIGELGVKPATQFRKTPLKGLWHKHFFSARFLPHNILASFGKDGMKKIVEEVFNNGEKFVTKEMISNLARRIAHETPENRAKEGKLTGEWIVFAKHSGKNYWLCTNTHAAGDQFIYDRIIAQCVRDFPDIKAWIDAAAI